MKQRIASRVVGRIRREGDILSNLVIYGLLAIVVLIMLLPFIHEVAKSLSYPTEVAAGRVALWPKKATLGNYLYFKKFAQFPRSFMVSVYITVFGTLYSVFITSLIAFPLSRPKKEFLVGGIIMKIVLFAFIFFPPLIPYFLSIRSYGMMDSVWAIIIPHTVFPFNAILLINFFRNLPEELIEASRIDGAGDFTIYRHVAIPLSKAALTTIGIFLGVILWNIYLHALLFISNPDIQPLQPFVRSILSGGGDVSATNILSKDPFAESESSKSALIVMTTLPVVLVFPMLRKYYIKGAMLGALKS